MQFVDFRENVTPRAGVWIEILFMRYLLSPRIASLPVRECGLKYDGCTAAGMEGGSLPVRECGLKLKSLNLNPLDEESLPVRECGLKFFLRLSRLCILMMSLPVRECGLKS